MILISACLAGMKCKWNMESAEDEFCSKLFKAGKAIPVCPEQLGGLPTPREPSERLANKVFAKSGKELTAEYVRGAEESLKIAEAFCCKAAIFKSRSPSCGVGRIYDGSFTGKLVAGDGVTTALLKSKGIVVVDESMAKEFLETEEAVLDLTHTIEAGMPVYPGTEAPNIKQAATIEKDGFAEKLVSMFSHTGTHMDAPAHIISGAKTLDAMHAGQFCGRGIMLPVAGPFITMTDAVAAEGAAKKGAEFVLFCSGWDKFWGKEEYYKGFPVLTKEAAEFIAGLGLKGIGFDCISADPVEADLKNHQILLGAGMVIIENLCGLDRLEGKSFNFFAFPLKLSDADGSPVRAAAVLR